MLRLIQRTAGQHKLSAPWEGPFVISKALGNDSYYLIDAQKPRARKRETMERKPPEKILQLKAVCIMLLFFFKYETNGPPEAHSGTALLYL